MSDRTRLIEDLFHDALERPSDERPGFLDAACHGDTRLRAEVESLLTADDCTARFLEKPAPSAVAGVNCPPLPPSSPESCVGRRIGDYQLVRLLASGGMGVVYEAQQSQPRRRVALKLMRTGLASRSAVRRFEYEAQILARLSHPGIAQVYEAGTHEDAGQIVPYFALEYIEDAQTLTDYAECRQLATRDRL